MSSPAKLSGDKGSTFANQDFMVSLTGRSSWVASILRKSLLVWAVLVYGVCRTCLELDVRRRRGEEVGIELSWATYVKLASVCGWGG